MQVDYPRAIALLTETSEHANLITEAVSPVLAQLPRNADFLDIGAADGRLTKMIQQRAEVLGRSFKRVTVMEKDFGMAPLLREKDFDQVIIDELTESSQISERFDFILCSHMLYHLSAVKIKKLIVKLLELSKPEGVCVIALIGPELMNHEFHHEINPGYTHSGHINEALEAIKIPRENIQVIEAVNTFCTTSKEQMRNLFAFFVAEDCLSSLSPEKCDAIIDRYTETSLADNGEYRLEQREHYFVLRTPPG